MRCFVESVLRYGLPVNFAASLLLPVRGADKKLREVLKQLYGNLANANLTSVYHHNTSIMHIYLIPVIVLMI
jgi:hypothetical protein